MKKLTSVGLVFILALAALIIRFKDEIFRQGEQKNVLEHLTTLPHQKRVMRELTLANNLTVLLISDPEVQKSAAAMDVAVGTLADPSAHLGLAHFLEHMLFMGTEKFPDVDEFNRYLRTFQGYSNAYTSDENTNYHFEVNHQGFGGALQRFAQFFIAPTFDPHFIERERNAVHSEHEKNLQSDSWRTRTIANALRLPSHPSHRFTTGNRDTLKNVTRDILVKFHHQHYSANTMKLVLLSSLPLDKMAELAQQDFSAIIDRGRQRPHYGAEIYTPGTLPQMVTVKAIKDLKKLSLLFATPNADPHWRSKPASLICHLVGHESQGSLLSWLKKQDLATSLSAGHDSTSYGGTFYFDLSLTDKGLADVDTVIAQFFTYISMLKEKGLESYIFDEQQAMGAINYTYRDLREGAATVSHFAELMQLYPAVDIEKNDSLFFEKDPEAYKLFLATITPATMLAMVVRNQAHTDRIEPYYGSAYRVDSIQAKTLAGWENISALGNYHLPPPNEFIPKKLALLESAAGHSSPSLLIDDQWGSLWFQGDNTFLLPKGYLQMLLLSEEANRNPRQKVLASLYVLALNESLNEWNYNITLAGLHYGVNILDRGIQLDFSGYSENLPALLEAVSERMHALTLDEEAFAAVKDSYKRMIANAKFDAPYSQSLYEASYLSVKDMIHRSSLYDPEGGIDLISAVSLNEVKAFARETLFASIALEGAAYGNLEAAEIKQGVSHFISTLSAHSLPKERRPENRQIKIAPGKTYVKVMPSSSNNNCWLNYLQVGPRSPKLNALLRVALAHLRDSFFNELRTNQQLGYVVHSNFHNSEKSLGLDFVIQSAQYSPLQINERVKTWQSQALSELEQLSDEEFTAFKTAVATDLREKDKTMGDRHQSLIIETTVFAGAFDYKEQTAKAAEALSKAEVVSTIRQAFNPEQNSVIGIHFYLQKAKELPPPAFAELIKNSLTFKAEMPVF